MASGEFFLNPARDSDAACICERLEALLAVARTIAGELHALGLEVHALRTEVKPQRSGVGWGGVE